MSERQSSTKEQPEAVLVVPIDEQTGRITLVFEEKEGRKTFWKFPGGGIEPTDTDPGIPDPMSTAERAAKRELEEETGLQALRLLLLGIRSGGGHRKFLFVALADFRKLKRRGNDGEIPQQFSLAQIENLKANNLFLPCHYPILDLTIQKIAR